MNHPSVPPINRQQVIGALKATGSTDPDVLYTKKEELLAPAKAAKMHGLPLILIGIVCTVLILPAVIGIPAIFYGLWTRRCIRRNTDTVEAAYAEYLTSIGAAATRAV